MNAWTHFVRTGLLLAGLAGLLAVPGCQKPPGELALEAVSALCDPDMDRALDGLTTDSQRVFRGLRTLSPQQYGCDGTEPLQITQQGWSGTEEEAGVYLVTLTDGRTSIKAAMVREDGEWKLDLFSSAQMNLMWGDLSGEGLPLKDAQP